MKIRDHIPSWVGLVVLLSTGLYLRLNLGMRLVQAENSALVEAIWQQVSPGLAQTSFGEAFSSVLGLVGALGVRKTVQLLPQVLSYLLFGIEGAAAYIPQLFLAALTGLLLFFFARRHVSANTGMVSLFLWALLPASVAAGTVVSSDQLLALMGLGSISLFLAGKTTGKRNYIPVSLGLLALIFIFNAAIATLYSLVLAGAWLAWRGAARQLWLALSIAAAGLLVLQPGAAQILFNAYSAFLRQDYGIVIVPLLFTGLFGILKKPRLSPLDHTLLVWLLAGFVWMAWPASCQHFNGCTGSLAAEFPLVASIGFYIPLCLVIATLFTSSSKLLPVVLAASAIFAATTFVYVSAQPLPLGVPLNELPSSIAQRLLFFSDIASGMILPAVVVHIWLQGQGGKKAVAFSALLLFLVSLAVVRPLWGFNFAAPEEETRTSSPLASILAKEEIP